MDCVRHKVLLGALAVPAGAILGACFVLSASVALADEAGLSANESALQGTWQDKSGWVLVFDGQSFSAKSGTSWYQGSFSAPSIDDDPAPLDLDIEDCGSCKYKGMTSRAIYRWEDKGLLLSGPTPGKSRPPIFDDTMGLVLELTRVAEAKKP